MKNVFFLIFVTAIGTSLLFGQKLKQGINLGNGQFTISYCAQQQNDGVILPLIEGKHLTGSKERYGILFRTAQAKNPMIEILDGNGKVIKSISLDNFIGKTASDGVKLSSNVVSGNGHESETIHEIKLPDGLVKLVTRALLVGNKNNNTNPEQIIMTVSLVSGMNKNFSLRMNLPVEGIAEVKTNGIVLTGKSSSSAIALSVMPANDSISFKKNMITLQSLAVAVLGETPMIWFTVQNASGATQNASKTLAADLLSNLAKKNLEANVVIVNMVSKENAQPGDTVIYTLVCKNIGMGAATNIILSNPIPVGTKYIDGSASVDGADLVIERNSTLPPQASAVTGLQWKLKEALNAGKDQTANFKVVIQ